ncbi:NAD-dependent epimerase/dehydratase family protein [Rhodovibrio sodomensis]|uniref:NAD-dependent epimerase/dehydratase family protein n=1 Tax=Rhodovibrio sodomensis TaxID=1088 RepID=UPI001F5B7BAC|nr:NAD-dependent epimerase/dehydratase family protein [Rhodovibrio sodomensis]
MVTGGCGFIGHHLIARLAERNHDVVVLDDLSTGVVSRLPKGTALIQGDVADRAGCDRAMAGVEACLHLAAIASVQVCQEDWTRATQVNLLGTVNVLAAAAAAGNVPVVYASSAAVYGDLPPPAAEDAPCRPLGNYGVDKFAGEQHARAAGLATGLPTFGLRFFNVFGPGQDPSSPYSGVIARFADRLRAGDVPTIYGDGQQSRDFVYVEDVVAAILSALERTSATAPVVNVCTGRSVDLVTLAAEMSELLGQAHAPSFEPARPGDIRHSRGDPALAEQLLGVRAQTPLRQGLQALLADH